MTYLTRIDPERNMARWYSVHLQPTLFGEWSVIRSWGRLEQRGQSLERVCETEEEARNLVGYIKAKKLKRGYRDRNLAV